MFDIFEGSVEHKLYKIFIFQWQKRYLPQSKCRIWYVVNAPIVELTHSLFLTWIVNRMRYHTFGSSFFFVVTKIHSKYTITFNSNENETDKWKRIDAMFVTNILKRYSRFLQFLAYFGAQNKFNLNNNKSHIENGKKKKKQNKMK